MVYQVPASKASIKQNVFEFNMPGDRSKKYTVPKLKYLRPALVRQLDHMEPMELVEGLIEAYHPGLFAEFEDMDQVLSFYEGWAESSGVTLGEFEASSES